MDGVKTYTGSVLLAVNELPADHVTLRVKEHVDTLGLKKVIFNIKSPESSCAGGKQVWDIGVLVSGFLSRSLKRGNTVRGCDWFQPVPQGGNLELFSVVFCFFVEVSIKSSKIKITTRSLND